jgi:hypothetical protein
MLLRSLKPWKSERLRVLSADRAQLLNFGLLQRSLNPPNRELSGASMRQEFLSAGLCASCALLAIATPAIAREHFQVYEGRNSIQEGQGGTRVSANGIDYWTTGTPPRRYQILGVIVDKRCLGRICGDPVGSKSVAETVKQNGGDAIIVLDQQEHIRGYASGASVSGEGNFASGFGWSAPVGNREAMLAVVRYMPADQASPPQPAVPVAPPPAASTPPQPK